MAIKTFHSELGARIADGSTKGMLVIEFGGVAGDYKIGWSPGLQPHQMALPNMLIARVLTDLALQQAKTNQAATVNPPA